MAMFNQDDDENQWIWGIHQTPHCLPQCFDHVLLDSQIMECSVEASLGDLELEKSFFSYDWNACCVCHKTWRKECRCFSPKAEHGDILEDVGNPKVNVGHENGNKGPELLMASSCTAVHDEIMMLGLCSYRLARFLGSSSTFS